MGREKRDAPPVVPHATFPPFSVFLPISDFSLLFYEGATTEERVHGICFHFYQSTGLAVT